MRRYSIIILVFFLLIINTIMNRAAEASPLVNEQLWQHRHDIAAGVLGAALCIAIPGIGAQVWRGILPACGAEWSPQRIWSTVSVCGLWCGWLPLLCAAAFYPLGAAEEATRTPSPWLIGAFVALVLCRMLSLASRQRIVGIATALVSAAAAVLCGQILWPALPLDILTAGLLSAPALYMLYMRDPERPMVWVFVAACFFCAYAAAFGYLLAVYPPSGSTPPLPFGMGAALLYTIVGLSLIALPKLRHSLWARRTIALLALLLTAGWIYLHLRTAGHGATLGVFVGALVAFGLPMQMMLHSDLHR